MIAVPQTRARLADVLFVAALSWYVIAGLAIAPKHGDEFMQMAMARDVFYLARGQTDQLRFSPPVQPDTEQQLRLINGPINKDFIGLLWIVTDRSDFTLPSIFAWAQTLDWNAMHGNVPDADSLNAARVPSTLLTAAGVILIFIIGLRAGGRKAAYPTALLYALHPVILLSGRRAMMDGELIGCTLLLIVATLWLTSPGRKRAFDPLAWALFGICAGLTVCAKHTGLIPVAAMLIAALWNSWRTPDFGIRRALLGVTAAGLIAVATFLVLNPAYWNDPVGAASATLSGRSDLLATQTMHNPTTYTNVIDRVTGTLSAPYLQPPQYFEAPTWQGVIDDAIQNYETSTLSGWRWPIIVGVLLTVLGGLGAILVAIHAIRDQEPVARVLLVWFASSLFGALIIPLDWQRYYLPWLLPLIVLTGYAPAMLLVEYRRVRAVRRLAVQVSPLSG
jgi:4-amino-4-deoxy-L-arabinose transferase-like glycosyltransferase